MHFVLLTAFLATLPQTTQPNPPAGSTCAIPLLNVLPRDANPDPGMIIIRPKFTSHMPQVIPPTPACRP